MDASTSETINVKDQQHQPHNTFTMAESGETLRRARLHKSSHRRKIPSFSSIPEEGFHFNVQRPPDGFTGREDILDQLERAVHKSASDGSPVVVVSSSQTDNLKKGQWLLSGGEGKTAAVRQLLENCRKDFENILWIDASSYASTRSCFVSLAERLDMNVQSKYVTDEELTFQVWERLLKNKNTLIVYDQGASLDGDAFKAFLPTLRASWKRPAVVVITTTSRSNTTTDETTSILLPGLSPKECSDLLGQYFPNDKLSDDTVTKVREISNGAPLALLLVVGFIQEENKRRPAYSVKDFVEYFEARKDRFLTTAPSSLKCNLYALLTMSYSKIVESPHGVLAIQVLIVMCYLSPTHIPKELIQSAFSDDPEALAPALQILLSYNLIQDSSSRNYFEVPRTVQTSIIEQMRAHSGSDQGSRHYFFSKGISERNVMLFIAKHLDRFLESLSTTTTSITADKPLILQNGLTLANHMENCLLEKKFLLFSAAVGSSLQYYDYPESSRIFTNLYRHITETYSSSQAGLLRKALYYNDVGETGIAIHLLLGSVDELVQLWPRSHRRRLKIEYSIAVSHRLHQHFELSYEALMDIYKLQERFLGATHPDTLATQIAIGHSVVGNGSAGRALSVFQQILEVQTPRVGELHPDTVHTKLCIINVLNKQKKYGQAGSTLRELHESLRSHYGDDDPLTINVELQTAHHYQLQRLHDEALEILRKVLEKQKRMNGENHRSSLSTLYSIALSLEKQGNFKEATKLLETVVRGRRQVLGENHYDTIVSQSSLAQTWQSRGLYEKAAWTFMLVLGKQKKTLGDDNPYTIATRLKLAETLQYLKFQEQAISVYEHAFQLQRASHGEEHRGTIKTQLLLAQVLWTQKRFKRAISLYHDLLGKQERLFGEEHKEARSLGETLSHIYREQSAYEQQTRKIADSVHRLKKSQGATHGETVQAQQKLCLMLQNLNQLEQASELLEKVLVVQKKSKGEFHPETLATLERLALVMQYRSRFEDAERILTVVLQQQRKLLGPSHLETIFLAGSLIRVLEEQRKFRQAEQLSSSVLEQLIDTVDGLTSPAGGAGDGEDTLQLLTTKTSFDPETFC